MAAKLTRPSSPKPGPTGPDSADRYPTREELLADLTTYGSKKAPPVELRAISRRTRDFLLTAGIGSAGIIAVIVKVLSHSDGASTAKLAFTAVALFCGLLWYVFYGVISRY